MTRHPRIVALFVGTLVAGLLPAVALAASPVAVDDAYPILEDAGAASLDVRSNDSDPDGDLLTITAVTLPAHGTATTDGQTVTYTPNANFNGSDSFGYTIDDGTGGTASANVTVTVVSVDDAPSGANTTVVTLEDTQYVFATGDFGFSDPNDSPSDAMQGVVVTTVPAVGTLTDTGVAVTAGQEVSAADIGLGRLAFTPAPNQNGSGYATFTFQVRDDGGTATGGIDLDQTPNSMTISVTAQNDAPVANDDSLPVARNAAATPVNVLFNDTDVDGDPLTITGASTPSKGVVAITGGGSGLTYRPTTNATGGDSFTYDISDRHGGTASATVTVTINASNTAPVAVPDSRTVAEDAAATPMTVLLNDTDADGDPLTITSTSTATKGVVAITGGGTGLTYKPNANANGGDSFTYTISDGHGGTSTATVSVTITPVNDVPNAVNDIGFTVPESAGATALAVKANDIDIDGDTLTITGVSNGAHGVVAITGSGTGLTYDPFQVFSGTDVFTYTVSDGHGGSDTATVLVNVGKDTTAPTVTAPVESFYSQTVGSSTMRVHLAWSGSDLGTGIAKYQLQVSINGGAYATITLGSAASTTVNRTLSDGKSYRYRVRATDRQGNVSAFAYGPTFKPARFQNSSSVVSYAGSWTTSRTSKALGGSHRFASRYGARASLARAYWDIAIVATRTPGSGSAQVWIDGVLSATINLHASSSRYRQLVYQHHFSTLAMHRIDIRPIGGGRVYLDAILLYR